MTARLGQPTTSLAYRYWYECARKRPYPTQDEAEDAVRWVETPVSRPHVYACRYADHWHIGREQIPRRQKDAARRRRNKPSLRVVRRRLDLGLLLMIGERAYHCGKSESEGTTARRVRVIRRRGRRAERVNTWP